MAGNMFGELFRVVTFGESHGPAMGCVIDGCPAGLLLAKADIERELRRRRPGQGGASTARNETDEPEILSGVFKDKTLGTPIAIVVRNADHHSADYENLRDLYRPGHADRTWEDKYGIRDHRGGGRSSGRETLCRVAAGAVAKVLLTGYGIAIRAWVSSIAGLDMPEPEAPDFDFDEIERNPFRVPGREGAERALAKIAALKAEGDSAGGIVSCAVTGVPPGLGEPVFDKLDARLAAAILSLGACKGVEFGAGFAAARSRGSENNDIPVLAEGGAGRLSLSFKTNNAGGILGGISSGQRLEFKAAFKPTPSISKPQQTADRGGAVREMIIQGRHDVCVVPRAVPVVEAMTALVLADFVLLQRAARLV
ncbi:MAG: chorismate synthase [Treponema sp.]|jgi:chorismate synthase|nr:chorismate synthase [Treponema sp.]